MHSEGCSIQVEHFKHRQPVGESAENLPSCPQASMGALSVDDLTHSRTLYPLWQDQRVCFKIEVMHCDICQSGFWSSYLQNPEP